MEGPGIHPKLRPFAVPIDSIRTLPVDENPRRGDVATLRAILRQFGQRRLLTIRPPLDDDDELPVITAGNTVYLAAVEEGWTEIAVLDCDDDDDEMRAWIIADNRSSEVGHTNRDLLDTMLAELAVDAPELVTSAGFDLDSVLADMRRVEPVDEVGDYRPFEHFATDRPPTPAAHAGTDLDDPPPPRPAPTPPPPDPTDPGPAADPPPATVAGDDLAAELARRGERADRPAKYEDYGKTDPDRGDDGLRVVFQFGDLRCKVSRAAYAEFLDKYLRVAGNVSAAGVAVAIDMGIDPRDVSHYARL